MATWVIQHAYPAAGTGTTGQAAFVNTGLSLDDTTTGTGTNKSILDGYTGSTTAIKVGKFLNNLQRRYEKDGKAYRATADGGSSYQYPIL